MRLLCIAASSKAIVGRTDSALTAGFPRPATASKNCRHISDSVRPGSPAGRRRGSPDFCPFCPPLPVLRGRAREGVPRDVSRLPPTPTLPRSTGGGGRWSSGKGRRSKFQLRPFLCVEFEAVWCRRRAVRSIDMPARKRLRRRGVDFNQGDGPIVKINHNLREIVAVMRPDVPAKLRENPRGPRRQHQLPYLIQKMASPIEQPPASKRRLVAPIRPILRRRRPHATGPLTQSAFDIDDLPEDSRRDRRLDGQKIRVPAPIVKDAQNPPRFVRGFDDLRRLRQAHRQRLFHHHMLARAVPASPADDEMPSAWKSEPRRYCGRKSAIRTNREPPAPAFAPVPAAARSHPQPRRSFRRERSSRRAPRRSARIPRCPRDMRSLQCDQFIDGLSGMLDRSVG